MFYLQKYFLNTKSIAKTTAKGYVRKNLND